MGRLFLFKCLIMADLDNQKCIFNFRNFLVWTEVSISEDVLMRETGFVFVN
jgi:hypothetical protein